MSEEGSGDVVPLGAGYGSSHQLHQRLQGGHLGARLGDDPLGGVGCTARGPRSEIPRKITEPH